jgi:hypothetical protein
VVIATEARSRQSSRAIVATLAARDSRPFGEEPIMSDAKTYSGSCHCGNVKYDVELELAEVMQGNCSMCSRTGALLAFVPEDKFTLKSGENLPDYQFNKKNIHYFFCPTCGIRSFARGIRPDGKKMVAINTRCLEGVDATELPVKHFDCKNL